MQGDSYCLALPWLAHMISRIFCHQSKCSAARPSPCFGTMPHIVACVCSPLCHHLYTIFHIIPECVHLSLSTCNPLFMFWHLILCCSSSYCISHAIIRCQMTILISHFLCLTARVSSREECSIRPLAPLFAYLWI